MIRYVGLDVHKDVVQACVIDEQGRRLESHRLPCTKESLEAFVRERLQATDHVALEATTNTWAVVALLRPHVEKIVVGNPLRIRAIAEAKVKTDKIDAEVIAQLLRCDYLPAVWQPDEDMQRLRELSAHRTGLVADQTRLKNRVRSLLAQRLIVAPLPTFFGVTGRQWLREVELSCCDRLVVDGFLRLLDQLEAEQVQVEKTLAELSCPKENVRLLMTLPGVGAAAAQALAASLGDWRRFPDGDAAASYLGLTPSVRQSANCCRYGHLTKAGNPQARWLLTQAAQQVAQHPGPLGVFFRRLKVKKNHNVAVVATARKLVVIAHLMRKNREPYRYALPETTRGKLADLRVLATGERRKKAGPLREPMQRREPGVRARKTPALNEVYADEALPPARKLDELTPGEKKALAAMGVSEHAARVQTRREQLYRRQEQKTG